jgi:hypothetical protein
MTGPTDEQSKLLTEALLDVLHKRKGFDWWWDEIGADNRAAIKRQMRAAAKRVLKSEAGS